MHVEGCVACHMIDGVGGQRGPDLTKLAERSNEGQLYTRIMNGGGGMPAYGNTMTPQQANTSSSTCQATLTSVFYLWR